MSPRICAKYRIDENGPQIWRIVFLIFLFVIADTGVARAAQSALPHFAAGGGFVTGFYAVNTRNQSATYSISFYDDSGKPVALSFSGLGSRTILSDTLQANGTKYYEADSPTGTLLSGAAMITADAGISIQALFRRRGSGANYSEAAVPASSGFNQFIIPFDDTVSAEGGAQIYTGLGLANMDTQQVAHVTCTARDAQGAVIVNAISVPALNPLGHWAGYQFPALLQKRGTLNCTSNAKIGTVALRFVDNSMSSLPVIDSSAATQIGRQVLPHFAVGGGFKTGFYVVNTDNRTAAYEIKFYDDNGQRVALSFAGSGSLDSLYEVLPPYAARYFEANSPTGNLLSGSANVAREPSVTVQAVFMRRGSAGEYSEAAIPASAGTTNFTIPFDDTIFAENKSQIYTGLALANMDVQTAHVKCTATDTQGAVIANALSVPNLAPIGHWAGYDFPALLGKRGTLACTSDLTIAPVALRFLGNAMSSLPTIASETSSGPSAGGGTPSGLKEYRDPRFSFQYPANLAIVSSGADPNNSRMTLIRLAASDGSQMMEVRYAAHQPYEVGWSTQTATLIGEFNRTQVRAIFLDWQYPLETSDSGAVYTELWTNNLRDKNIEVIGTGIWARFDYANIILGYDRSRVSRSARDTVFQSLTFARSPSLSGRWQGKGLELFFNPASAVNVTLGLNNENDYHTTGRYTSANNRLEIAFQFNGTAVTWQCGYSVTLGWLHMDCGTAGSKVLRTQPDLDDFGPPTPEQDWPTR